MSTIATRHPQPATRPTRRWRMDQQNEAYLFLLPSMAGFLLFVILPMLASVLLSLGELKLSGAFSWVGIANYREMLNDSVFWQTVRNTAFFMVTIVPLQLAFGLMLALALNQPIRGRVLYRLIYFMPVVTTIVAAAIVFQLLLNRDFGPISEIFWKLGFTPPNFLGDPSWQKPSVVLLTLWKNTGFTMVIYLAALQGVPQELYDAANVDGATAWQRFRNVTVPLISPTTFFLFVLQMIGAFQLFTEAYVMTRGSSGTPAQATMTVVYYIYQNAFSYNRMGKAAAIAWFLFFFIFLFTLIQTRMQRRWVYYEVN
ncbi:MAG: sugar ABC transporter permease [Caldilineaceae bacterium]